MTLPSARLRDLGLTLPSAPAPAGSYIPARRAGNLVYTSGQVPVVDGKLAGAGKVGAGVSPDEATELARVCALNALAAVHALVGIDAIVGIVKVVGFVASAPGFNGQPGVVNGASDLFREIFADAGAHARSAVGVAELPLDAPVEVEIIVEVSAP
jgi:enamine deaminase RidA (YjgF/YER057c/UK114 family)